MRYPGSNSLPLLPNCVTWGWWLSLSEPQLAAMQDDKGVVALGLLASLEPCEESGRG